MNKWISLATLVLLASAPATAATIEVAAGGNLQAAINAAQPGDTIRLAAGATYTGNFVLPAHGGATYVTIITGGTESLLPPAGTRITPAHSPYLARIQSPNSSPAMRAQAGAAYWRLQWIEFLPTSKGYYDILALGDGSSVQDTVAEVPHHLIVDRVYIHGDRLFGQKRGIALNGAYVTIVNSHVSDIKAAGQDSQAIGGWNGTGPYHVENNYLEAAGDVILIGGDDPKIPGLIATDLTFRRNTMTRPVEWREPMVPTPTGIRAALATGSLPAGTYAYRIAARQNLGASGTGISTAAAQVVVTTPGAAGVTLSWDPVPNAADYVVYGRTSGGQNMYWLTTATSFTDVGGSGAAGTPPSKGTVWTVKNIFELKNARQVVVADNLLENNWANAQTGVAVLFTVRNQYGGCTWCVVEDVTFERNVVRHTGGAITVLGWDNNYASQQTNRIRIRHNEFSDYSKFWGGTGYAIHLDGQPRDVTIDHNTFVAGTGAGMLLMSGDPMTGVEITNNVARHDTYGVIGSGKGIGTPALAYYAPGGVFTRNVLAGGNAWQYPAGNFFPTVASFAAHFVDYANWNFALLPGTDWERAGTDGLDLGAAYLSGYDPAVTEPLSILTTGLPPGMEGISYSATIQGTGGRAPYRWSVVAGALPVGLILDSLSGSVAGAPLVAGDAAFTIELQDSDGATVRQPFSVHVEGTIDPVEIVTAGLPPAISLVPYATALQATGGLGTYSWMLTGGQLPAGLSLSAAGSIAGTPTAAGTFAATVTVVDAADPSRSSARTFSIAVTSPPNAGPSVTLTTSSEASVQAGAPVTLNANALDPDGTVVRVDFVVDGSVVRTALAAPFSFNWTATAGTHTFSARAFDNGGTMAVSGPLSLTVRSEIVLHAVDVKRMSGRYQLAPDVTAADGVVLLNPNRNSPKVSAASQQPNTYAEFEFYAEAGRTYHVWIRSKAHNNDFVNDSAYLQFSNVATAKIGTTTKLIYQLEDAPTAGLDGWGWQDNDMGTYPGQFGTAVVFDKPGLQVLRVQPREDGLSIDQIVVSPATYLTASPGSLKRDNTLIPR